MLNFWNELFSEFSQSKVSSTKWRYEIKNMCRYVCIISWPTMHCTRWIWKYEKDAKEMIQDVDYTAATTRKRIRQKISNDWDTPEVYLNARDKFRLITFYTIVDKLATEMKRTREIYKDIAERFSFLSHVPYNVTSSSTNIERYSLCCQKLIDAYPEDFNSNFSAQFHLYVRDKFNAP